MASIFGVPRDQVMLVSQVAKKRKRSPWEKADQEFQLKRWKQLRSANIYRGSAALLGPDSQFRRKRETAIKSIVSGESPIVAIMATGCGKSVLFMLPAIIAPGGITIVVTPLVSLQGDMQERCEKARIPVAKWTSRTPCEAGSIMFVPPESAMTKAFAGFIVRKKEMHRLDRIMFDECHTILDGTPQFRLKMRQLGGPSVAEPRGPTTVPSKISTVTGLSQAYSFGPEFAAALSVIAIGLTGDLTAGTWSIGGPYPPSLLGGLLSNPTGISRSHNVYESDTSPARSDAYLNGSDAVSLNITRFDKLYSSAEDYTLDILRDHNKLTHDDSINNNPYYFSAPFAGLVPPIAHHFIVNLMSNHSATNIQGYLDRSILKTFFSVSGPDNAHVWNAGQERIPLNWYKRPSNNPYGAVAAAADVAILATKYPEIVQFGGNTGTPNSFVGVDPGALSGGVYNAQNLLQGDNLSCFFFQAAQQVIPSVLRGLLGDLAPFLNTLNGYINPVTTLLGCPALLAFDQSAFEQFPGYGYHPARK